MTDTFAPSDRGEREEIVRKFFRGTGKSYDRCVAVTTYGLDRRWKDRLMKSIPQTADRVLDLACGTGIVLDRLHKRFPDAALVGVDFTKEYLDEAKRRFEGQPLDLTLVHSNAETMELQGTFDVVVSSYIPKYVDPDVLLGRLEPHVRPGTVVSLQDFGYPRGFARVVWKSHMWMLKVFGPLVFPQWKVVFDENLADLIAKSKWQRRYRESFKQHGYTNVTVEPIHHRAAYIVRGVKA